MKTNFADIELNIMENIEHEYLMTTKDVAKGYGVSEAAIREHKRTRTDELRENEHFLYVSKEDAQQLTNNKMMRTATLWTKRGVVALGFFVTTKVARHFQAWSGQLSIDNPLPPIDKRLVSMHNDTAVVSHKVVAHYTGNDERSISKLLTSYMSDFCEFGQLRFEVATVQSGQREGMDTPKTYLLNEQQATLLMTYLKNNAPVRNFKKALVKEFFELRQRQESTPQPKAQSKREPQSDKNRYLTPALIRELRATVSKEALDMFYQREVLGIEPRIGGGAFRVSERSWGIVAAEYERRGMRLPPKDDLHSWSGADKKVFLSLFGDGSINLAQLFGIKNWLDGNDGDPEPIYYDIRAANNKVRLIG